MENRGLALTVDKLPLIEEAFASIDNMEKFCNKILDSKLAPDHFYPKIPGTNDRDYTKGNTAAVMMVLIHGNQLHLPVLTSLQQIVPVNGLLSIKGDGAKGMILGSGKVQVNTWVETESGSIEDGSYQVTVSAERSDTREKLSRTFSVPQAKRAGLWITEQQANGPDGWKYKKSAWYKFPDRMVKYRALGFLARDLFPDVMAGTYTTEEAMDMPRETAEIIETESGAKITLPDKEHSQKRAEKMTARVSDKIKTEGFGPVDAVIMPPTVVNESKPEEPVKKEEPPFIPTKESYEGFQGEVKQVGETTINLKGLDTARLLEIINADMDMMEAMELIPGKNTNKKLKGIVEAHQKGTLTEYVASLLPPKEAEPEEVRTDQGEIPLNKDFDKQGTVIEKNAELFEPEPPKEVVKTNKYGLEIPELGPEGKRDFSVVKMLFNKMMGITPQITTPRYMELAEKLKFLAKYKDKEVFCREASVEEINKLLDSN